MITYNRLGMELRRDPRVVYIGAAVIMCVMMAANLIYLKSHAQNRLVEGFGLSGGAVDFALECLVSGEKVFGNSRETLILDFCGCLASDMAGSLGDDDLEFTATIFNRHGLAGLEVPTLSTAETAAEGRIAAAVHQGTLACRGHFDPRP